MELAHYTGFSDSASGGGCRFRHLRVCGIAAGDGGIVGLYGVMSFSVSSRTREIGIRLAPAATRGGVQRLVLQQGMLLSSIALGIGPPLALAAAKVAAGALYGIAPNDWVTFTAVPVFLAAVTLMA